MSVNHIIDAKRRKVAGHGYVDKEGKYKSDTLFDHIVNSDLPESELSVDRLASEAQVVMGAGTVTTARTMDYMVTHILLNPEIHQRLQDELREPMGDFPNSMPSASQLYQLPWLQACIKEALRLSPGLTHRLPRVFPDVDLVYKDWVIPRGVRADPPPLSPPTRPDIPQCESDTNTGEKTPVGMSAWYMHRDPTVYDRPLEFRPQRWLDNPTAEMLRNWVPFTKGSRRCLGVEYASCIHGHEAAMH